MANLVAGLLPPLAVVVAAVLSWNELVEPVDLIILVVGYGLTCVGITVGFHRLLTPRAFQTYPSVRHARGAGRARGRGFGDQVGYRPPQAPHLGWLFTTVGQADRRRFGADLLKDRGIRLIDAVEKPLILASLAIPFLLGLATKGSLTGRAAYARLGWLVAHLPAAPCDIQPQLDLPFLRPAFHGLRRREFDPGGLFIRGLERLGLAWDVVRVSPDCQLKKAIVA